jgi:hypothetical protein
MKNLLGKMLQAGTIALAAIAVPHLRAAPVAAVPGDALYVAIDTDDPLAFDRFRYADDGRTRNEDLIVPTLRNRGPSMAEAAHWPTPIVALNEDASPPPDEPVLRLTWSNGRVFAEFLAKKGAKPFFLGVVNRDSLSYHPHPDEALNRIMSATSGGAKHDETIRANTEMQLYLALDLLERHLVRK